MSFRLRLTELEPRWTPDGSGGQFDPDPIIPPPPPPDLGGGWIDTGTGGDTTGGGTGGGGGDFTFG